MPYTSFDFCKEPQMQSLGTVDHTSGARLMSTATSTVIKLSGWVLLVQMHKLSLGRTVHVPVTSYVHYVSRMVLV